MAMSRTKCCKTYPEFIHHPHTQATGLISWLPQAGSDKPWPVPNPPNLPQLQAGNPRAVSPIQRPAFA